MEGKDIEKREIDQKLQKQNKKKINMQKKCKQKQKLGRIKQRINSADSENEKASKKEKK